jgi:hypothetical protein
VGPTEYQEITALGLVFVVHVIGGVLLVWALIDDETRSGWRKRWGSGPGPNPPDDPPPEPPAPRPSPQRQRPAPAQLAAEQSRVRLRGPGRLADAHPRPPRRPEHVPQPARTPR